MLLRHTLKRPASLMRGGMACLVLGVLSLRYLHARLHVPPDLADGVSGLLYGLAIGFLLLFMRARRATAGREGRS